MIKKCLLWLAVVLMSVQIFSFSSATGTESGSISEPIAQALMNMIEKILPVSIEAEQAFFGICHVLVRKVGHFAEFMILGILTFSLARSYRLKKGLSALISGGYCMVYSITDEVHQLFVSERSGNFLDVFIDFSGALAGVGICYLVLCWCGKRKKKAKKS